MEEQSVDFVEWKPGQDKLELIYKQRLSYQKAYRELGKTAPTMQTSTNGEQYAKVILFVELEGLISKFDETVIKLRATFNSEIKRLNLISSSFGNDDTWIHWDLAKQLYSFLRNDRSETNRHYRIADPLSDDTLCDEIISRHIGWEFWYSGGREPWISNVEVRRLLGQIGSDGKQPASWALAQVRALIRSSSRSNRLYRSD